METHRISGDQLVGEARNTQSEAVQGPISVSVACFDEAGDLVGHHSGFTDQDSVGSGELLPFSVRLGRPCSGYLVALSGFAQ